jgi:trigger factor
VDRWPFAESTQQAATNEHPTPRRATAVKSAVETLNPTRVRLTVEVPFEELKPSLDAAYRKIARQVTVPGFRKGKVPARIIDQRFGRAVVLEEAVNEALPRFYGQAVEANDVQVLGQPDVDVTEFADGQELKFTAEVDVRPQIELPDYGGIEVTVDDADVTEEETGEYLNRLRDRFGTLVGVDRPIKTGDYVSIDLSATKDGVPVEEAQATGLSYQVGSGTLLNGLDVVLVGRSAGESATFTTTLQGGQHAGEDVEVLVTVKSVREKQLPELDDEFAQTASEFDTVEELRQDARSGLEQENKINQLGQARDRVLEALMNMVEVPLPERLVEVEVQQRREVIERQLQAAGLDKQAYLQHQGQTAEEFDAELEQRARDYLKAQLVLDAVARKEQLSVGEAELTRHLIQRAAAAGVQPDVYAQEVAQSGQVSVLISDVARSKALATVLEHARVRDASGRDVDIAALRSDIAGDSGQAADTEGAPETAGTSTTTTDAASPIP